MNYENFAKATLKEYRAKRVSLVNLREEIAELHARQTSTKTSRSDSVAVSGAQVSRAEENALNLICLIDEKTALYKRNYREVARIERALSVLPEAEREILEAFFIDPCSDPVTRLCEKYHYERSWVYNKRRYSIWHFAVAYYGAVNT